MSQRWNSRTWIACVLSFAVLGYKLTWSQAGSAPVEVSIPFAPARVVSNGQTHLVYELHITNFYRSTGNLWLESVEVFADDGATALVKREGSGLAPLVVHPRVIPPPEDPLAIPGGMRAVVYLWVTLAARAPVPTSLRHRLVFRDQQQAAEILNDARVMVRRLEPPVLGPPFRRGLWLVANGPGNHRAHHWGGLLALNGRVTIPQRFAMDLIGLDADGRAVQGDFRTSANKDWIGYGAEVLAVADGIVRETQDGMPEKVPFAPNPPTAPTFQAAGGNFIVLDVGRDVLVFYAHFQPGSVTVKTGDRVRRGQVLARLGNSGSTTAPHLHLHVTDTQSLQGSEGLPFAFRAFEALGRTSVERAIGLDSRAGPPSFTPKSRDEELPLDSEVIRFRPAQ